MFLPWFFISVFNVLDLWTTNALIRMYGSEVEANPISGWFIDHNLLFEAKAVVVGLLAIGCLWATIKNHPRIPKIRTKLWIVSVIYLAVVSSNIRYLTLSIH